MGRRPCVHDGTLGIFLEVFPSDAINIFSWLIQVEITKNIPPSKNGTTLGQKTNAFKTFLFQNKCIFGTYMDRNIPSITGFAQFSVVRDPRPGPQNGLRLKILKNRGTHISTPLGIWGLKPAPIDSAPMKTSKMSPGRLG